jgi:hypothetical protein
MFFFNYLPELPVHKTDIQDRLAKDSSNETLRIFLKLSDKIIRDYYTKNPDFEERSWKLIQDLKDHPEKIKENFPEVYSEFKDQLEFYFDNKKDIDILRIYIESANKVNKVTKDFFNKNQDK